MIEETIKIQWLRGEIQLEPVKYKIVEKTSGSWWWQKTEYFLQSDFGILGPFDSRAELIQMSFSAGIDI